MVDTLRNNLIKRWGYSKEKAHETVVHFDLQKYDELINGNWDEDNKNKYGNSNSNIVIEKGLNGIIKDQTVDVIIGGPPCQAYSIAGRAQDVNSMKEDYRNFLFESFVNIVDHYKPKLFVFENVPGMLSAKPGDKLVIDRIYEAFEKIGYEIRKTEDMKKSIYSSADFDVPQDRKRVIIIGVAKGFDKSVEDFYTSLDRFKSKNPHKTLREAIGSLPKFQPLTTQYKKGAKNISHELIGTVVVDRHTPRYNNLRDIQIFKTWIEKSMNSLSTQEKLDFYTKMTGKKSKHNKYRSLDWDKPSPTIVSHLHKDGLMFIHPDVQQLRSITIREAAILQTFPDEYEFIGSDAYCFKMIGNAVPILFAKSIALSIVDVLNGNNTRKLNVLVACEESQRVCNEFLKLGHNAYSCDLLECSGSRTDRHFNQDVLEIIKNKGGVLQNGDEVFLDTKWDLMIAHPPCTFLAVSGAKWYYHPDDKALPIDKRRPHPSFPNRANDREEAYDFFMKLANAEIEYIAIENPVGIMNTRWRKPDQTVQPYHFGDEASKKTCLWLKNLPPLEYTDVVGEGEFIEFSSGRRLAKWYSDGLTKTKTAQERRTWRSKTFPGFAKAIADQWSKYVCEQLNKKEN